MLHYVQYMDDAELNEIVRRAGGPDFERSQTLPTRKTVTPINFGINPFIIERASGPKSRGGRQHSSHLFGDVWRQGEVAMLIGEPGVGKSLLATQIAEVAARGWARSINGVPASRPQHVIYFDLGRTREQFDRLYSTEPLPTTGFIESYRFSPRLDTARMDNFAEVPAVFRGRPDRYIRHWLCEVIAELRSGVVIIDSITSVAIGSTIERVMRSIRGAAEASGTSVLVTAPAKPKRRPSPVTLADAPGGGALIEMADSIFALGRSVLHADIRYVKDLKSRTRPLTADLAAERHDPAQPRPAAVLTYRIERLASPRLPDERSLPPRTSRTEAVKPKHRSPAFLGLNFVGLSLESNHLPDPSGTGTGSRPRRISSREAIARGLIDGSYHRYLLGD